MNSFLKLIIIAFSFCSCNADGKQINTIFIKEDTNLHTTNTQKTPTIKQEDTSNSSDESLIGKNINYIEKMGWFECAGHVINPSDKGEFRFAVSKLSKTQKECSNGKGKIVLEKIFYYKSEGKPIFRIIDELDFESNSPKNEYGWSTCSFKKGSDKFYIIHYKYQDKAEFTEIYDLWTLDLELGKFVKVKDVQGFSCINEDFLAG